MTFELLVAAVEKDIEKLVDKMGIDSNAVIVNQCDEDNLKRIVYKDYGITVVNSSKRGVGLSRNMALDNAMADILLFGDEDIVYDKDYEAKVISAFKKYPQASVITFDFDVDSRRRTYTNTEDHIVKWNNYGRYPAYAIAVKRKAILDNNIRYSLLFGGGAKYSNGEDSLFLHDCLKAGLKIMAVTTKLGREEYRESTWFRGYTEKFFFDRGVLYHFLYGKAAGLLGFRFLYNNRKTMCKSIGLFKAYGLLRNGIREGKTL